MANNGNNGDNNIDPLHQPLMITPPPSLFPLPEHDDGDVTIPIPTTPSELKNRLIFGPFPHSQSDLSLSQNPPPPSSSAVDLLLRPPELISPAPNHHRLHRSESAPSMAGVIDLAHPIDHHHITERSHSKPIAFALLVTYLSLGVLIYCLNRDSYYSVTPTHPLVDGLYFCFATMCTIGYGDIAPNSVATKLFSIFFVFIGFGFIYILLSGMDRMVTVVLALQENYMLKATRNNETFDEAERKRIRFKVRLSLGFVMLCLVFGVLVMHFVEKIGWFDSFYFSAMSVTTIGYGDVVFKTMPGRLLAAIWMLVSTLAVVRAFLCLVEARVDERSRARAKRVLCENISVSEFFAADIDHDGCLSKAEFVIYKLKKMVKITEMDIKPIADQFDRLDINNTGRITLIDLLENQHQRFY